MRQSTEKLLEVFFEAIQNSREKFVDLDLEKMNASCLSVLSSIGGGEATVMLLTAPKDSNELKLKTYSGALPFSAELVRMKLSQDDRKLLSKQPTQLETLEEFTQMCRQAFGREDVFGRALTHEQSLVGAIVVVPPRDTIFSPSDKESLGFFVRLTSTIQESAEIFSKLFHYAMIDDLTGLYNHRYFRKRLPSEIARASRHGHPLSCLFCEIDDFAIFADRNGHRSGNRLLTDLAGLLSPRRPSSGTPFSFRISDIAFRYGGEEFIVILPETPKPGALLKAEHLRRTVESMSFTGGEQLPLRKVTLSIGVATFPEDASDAVSILEAADRALHRAKENGKNCVQPL